MSQEIIMLLNCVLSNTKSALLKIFFIVAVLAGLSFFFVDEKLALWMSAPERGDFWLFNREITNIGESVHFFVICILTYIGARWVAPKNELLQKSRLNWPWLKEWSLQFFVALIFSGLLVHIFKFLAGRQRPHMSKLYENNIFVPLNTHWHWQSFPSGHSQTLLTVFVFLVLLFPKFEKWIFLAVFYLIMTRAFTHAHFVSDVLSGGYVGFLGAVLVLKFFKPKSQFLYSQSFLKNSKTL